MVDEGRRVAVDLPFEAALGETIRAIHAEGLEVIAHLDVRDHLRTSARHDFRRYEIVEAWAPLEALELLTADLARGATLPIRFAVFEQSDEETAVVVDDRGAHAGRVLGRLRRLPRPAHAPAA